MVDAKVPLGIVGTEFSPYEFGWDWQTSQLLARATGGSVRDERDFPRMFSTPGTAGHPMIPFNGALLARNRDEVMDQLIGGYATWQQVGRWGSGGAKWFKPVPVSGRAKVASRISELGGTSKGHALVRFNFEVSDASDGSALLEGWMLLFLLGCAPEGVGSLAAPRITVPDRAADHVVEHDTPVNTTFDWAVPSADWNTTHFILQEGNPAPLTHGPRNMGLVISDAARTFANGDASKLKEVTIGSLPAPHYPPEPTETRFWNQGDRVLGRLVVPAAARIDGGEGDKVCIDQVELRI
ncbi:MAG: hypothetical protein AB7J35_03070 [Dehalococcoidia bacterium]